MDNTLVGIIGFSTVFVVLVVLILFITVMSKLINSGNKKTESAQPEVKTEKQLSVKTEDDEDEIIAAITAAIACIHKREGKKFKIRSFRRV